MFDPNLLDPEARALWDECCSESEGSQFQLWSFGYICMLTLGRVPEIVEEALDPETDRMIREYKDARMAAWHAES